MVSLDNVGSEVVSKVSEVGKDFGWLTGSVGFYLGVLQKFDLTQIGKNGYPFSGQGVSDFLAQTVGFKLPGFGGTATRTFNPAAVLNREAAMALGLYFLKEIWPNKYTRAVANIAIPPLAGFALGKIFDDPPYSSEITSSMGVSQGTYTPTVRAFAPTSGLTEPIIA